MYMVSHFYAQIFEAGKMFKMPRWSARNPLGIIALFISLIYGMSALLLGTSVGDLQKDNEDLLVYFVVVFPVMVLIVFGWLVSRHHKKLYGPGDFQSDQGFLDANAYSNPASLGERLGREIEEEIGDRIENNEDVEGGEEVENDEKMRTDIPPVGRIEDDNVDEQKNSSNKQTVNYVNKSRNQLIREAYVAETLVFQDLQNVLNGSVKREVAVPIKGGLKLFARVDGIVESKNEITIVDVRYVRMESTSVERRVRESVNNLIEYGDYLGSECGSEKKVQYLCVVVLGADAENLSDNRMTNMRKLAIRRGVEVKYYTLSYLLNKYGLPSDSFSNSDMCG